MVVKIWHQILMLVYHFFFLVSKRNPANPKIIVYGASEIFNATQFVKQVIKVGI